MDKSLISGCSIDAAIGGISARCRVIEGGEPSGVRGIRFAGLSNTTPYRQPRPIGRLIAQDISIVVFSEQSPQCSLYV